MGAALVALAFVAPARAASAACGVGSRPWVHVSPPDAEFLPRLRAELAARGFDVCTDDAPRTIAPIASVQVDFRADGVGIAVSVQDDVTSKRVSRDFPLKGIPVDGRPLVIALAISELLRASWAELVMVDAQRPSTPVPEAVRVAVESDRTHPTAKATGPGDTRLAIGLALGVERFTGGQTFLGADARAALGLGPRLAGTLRLGLRESPTTAASHGTVGASALVTGIGATYELTPRDSIATLEAALRIDAWAVRFDASPVRGAAARAGSALTFAVAGGLAAWWHATAALELGGEAMALGVLRPVSASDNGVQVTAVSGIGVSGALSLRGYF